MNERAKPRPIVSITANVVRHRPLESSMFIHVMIGSNDLERARDFNGSAPYISAELDDGGSRGEASVSGRGP